MLPAPSRRLRCIQAGALVLALSACRSDAPKPVWETLRARGTPTLEEIFLLPGIQGRAPRAEEISADGRWVVFHFNPIEVSADGLRKISDEHSLRIQSTLSPESTDFEGLRIDDLLPKPLPSADPTDKPKETDLSFSHHGSRILARRERDLFLLDAPADPRGAWTVRNLLHADPEGELKTLGSARFDVDDSSVLVESGKDLWQFSLRADPAQAWPLSAADGTNLTAAIDAEARTLSFSRDLKVVFSRDPAIAKLAKAATETAVATDIPAQILWRETGTAVVLAGIADFSVIENPALSPDGRFLFATFPDRSHDPEKTVIPDYLSSRVSTREGRRELA
ncbi:MAG TPA: hypothetical protein VK843_18295, partial [Planctomycetota bacterium]|nr:hypothetical protein [Planctomycetota bacterium]